PRPGGGLLRAGQPREGRGRAGRAEHEPRPRPSRRSRPPPRTPMTATYVYKLGGPALEDPGLLPALAEEVRRAGASGRPVERALPARGPESRFVNGRRATSPEAMEVVEMVLSGAVNKGLAAGLSAA